MQQNIFSIFFLLLLHTAYIAESKSLLDSRFDYSSNVKQQEPEKSIKTNICISDSTLKIEWLKNFKIFSNAVKTNNKKRVKSFFRFPIKDDQNMIWNLILNDKNRSEIIMKENHLFTSEDFDKYYNKLITSEFKKCLATIDIEEIFDLEFTSSKKYKLNKSTSIIMNVYLDQESNELRIIMIHENKGINDEFSSESSISYEFNLLKTGKIIFSKINIAG